MVSLFSKHISVGVLKPVRFQAMWITHFDSHDIFVDNWLKKGTDVVARSQDVGE